MFITLGDAKLFTTSFGSPSAPAIVGIGGWTGSWELWLDVFSILSQDWHTVAYDHRGAGATVAPVESITFDNMVDDVFSVMDAYRVKTCVLAAESAGARTALRAALRHPERITGLVIVDGSYSSPPLLGEDPFLDGLRGAYAITVQYFVDACIPEPDSDHLKRWGRQILQRASQEAAIALYLVRDGSDIRNDLPKITQPALLIHGENDIIVALASSEALLNSLPNAKLTVMHGTGHVPTVTRPREVASEIQSFFALDSHPEP
ncbi:MAG: alpha/beta hydrolase [Anaerolineae bacterium]